MRTHAWLATSREKLESSWQDTLRGGQRPTAAMEPISAVVDATLSGAAGAPSQHIPPETPVSCRLVGPCSCAGRRPLPGPSTPAALAAWRSLGMCGSRQLLTEPSSPGACRITVPMAYGGDGVTCCWGSQAPWAPQRPSHHTGDFRRVRLSRCADCVPLRKDAVAMSWAWSVTCTSAAQPLLSQQDGIRPRPEGSGTAGMAEHCGAIRRTALKVQHLMIIHGAIAVITLAANAQRQSQGVLQVPFQSQGCQSSSGGCEGRRLITVSVPGSTAQGAQCAVAASDRGDA